MPTILALLAAITISGPIGSRQTVKHLPRVTIDLTQRGEKISPYVYGQFIEHLGRCINGGIWAEMLQDRKFLFPVTDYYQPYQKGDRARFPILRASPWRMVGNPTITTLKSGYRENPILVIKPTSGEGGIEQPRLTLDAGRKYVGRVVASGNVTIVAGGATMNSNGQDGLLTSRKFRFNAASSTDDGVLSITGTKPFQIAAVSLMPADNVKGFRADVIATLRDLGGTIYRWPGGNFASGYYWQDGLGDPDKRPTRPNPAWTGIEPNDMGLHEFMDFCSLVHTEPMVVVNTGFGGPTAAADWVEYCNGAANTRMGAWRTQNGHRQPFHVHWWGVGNEMFGGWQLGHMPVDQYVIKHNITEVKMKQVDPSIETIASGDPGGGWDEAMLRGCRQNMTLLSEHFYCQNRADTVEHALQIPNAVRDKVSSFERYKREIPELNAQPVNMSLDEWNYWYGPTPFGELGTRYFLKDGLGISLGLQEIFRHGNLFKICQYAQTVNVIGCVKTTPRAVWLETTGLVLKMYHDHYGNQPVGFALAGLPRGVDATAALTSDGKFLTVAITNATEAAISLQFTGLPVSLGEMWSLAGTDPMAFNDENAPHKLRIVHLDSAKIGEVAALSSTIYKVPVRQNG